MHVSATSQNIIDTALMLLARRAGALVVENVLQAPDAAATLAHTHRDSPMAARTLGQQALPTTFGALPRAGAKDWTVRRGLCNLV